MTIETQQVHWQGSYLSPDSEDEGAEPDVLPLEGAVTFTPVWSEEVSGFLSDASTAIHLRPFPFALRDGRLMSQDGQGWIPGVRLPARVGGVTLGWVAKFSVHAQGHTVPVRDISFNSNPGGVVSLVGIVPPEAVYPKFAPDVVRGDSVEDVHIQDGYLVFTVGSGARARQILVRLPSTAPLAGRKGDRPTAPVIGTVFFDVDLGAPVWWSGHEWVDAVGSGA